MDAAVKYSHAFILRCQELNILKNASQPEKAIFYYSIPTTH